MDPVFDPLKPFETLTADNETIPVFDETKPFEILPPPQPASIWDRPSMSSLNKIRSAFSDKKMFTDMGIPEEEGMKQALTAYYANGKPENIPNVYRNLSTYIKRFHNKDLSINQAYGEISNILNAKPETYKPMDTGNETLNKVIEVGKYTPSFGGLLNMPRFAASLANIASVYENMDRVVTKAIQPIISIGREEQPPEMKRMADEWRRNYQGFTDLEVDPLASKTKDLQANQKFLEEMAKIYQPTSYDKTVIQTFQTEGVGAAAKKLFDDTLVSAPELGIMLMGGIPYIVATSGARKYNELDMDPEQNLSESRKISNALSVGAVNGAIAKLILFDRVLGKKVGEKIGAPIKESLGQALLDFSKKWGLMQGQAEAMAVADFAINAATGAKNHSSFDDVLLNTFVESAPSSALFAGKGTYDKFTHFEKQRATFRNTLEAGKAEILANKDNLTESEHARLKLINTVLESRDMDKAMQLYRMEDMRQRLNAEFAKRRGVKPEEGIEGEDALDESQWAESDAAAARREIDMLNQMPHHPEDTLEAVRLMKETFPNLDVVPFNGVAEMPRQAYDDMVRKKQNPEQANAFVDMETGKVFLNMQRVAPSDAPKFVLQEYVKHFGLEKAFKKQDLDSLLDLVARDYKDDVSKINATYKFDVSNVDGARDAAKEFLAHGSTIEAKPSYWAEVVLKVRNWLRSIPGLEKLRFTDKEIEGMFSKAYRKARSQNDLTESVKTGDVKFSIDFKEENEYKSTITDFLNNADSAKGLSRDEIFSKFNNDLKPVARIEKKYADYLGVEDAGVYTGEAYFIDHRLNNHPDTTDAEYLTIPEVLSNPESVKVNTHKEVKGLVFIKKYDRYHAAVISLDAVDGKIILSKTFFAQTKQPYKKLEELNLDGVGGDATIDQILSESSAESISARPSSVKKLSQSPEKSSPDFKYSIIRGMSDQQERLAARILLPTVEKLRGDLPLKEKSLEILQKAGFNISSADDAHTAAVLAVKMIRDRRTRTQAAAKEKFRAENYPILSDFRKTYGENAKIKPSAAFKNEYESDFIVSRKTKTSVLSDEAAKKLGITEEELFKEIGKLRNVDIEAAFQQYKQGKTGKRAKIAKMQAELRDQGNFFAAYEIIHGDQPLNDWIIKNQPKVAEEVYMQMMGEAMPKDPKWDAVRAKLAEEKAQRPQSSSQSSMSSASSPKLGEGITYEKFKRMQIALERATADKVSIMDAQKAATELAMEMPVDKRGAFLHRIAKLAEFSDLPSPRHPEGRRQYELDGLLSQMGEYSNEVAKSAIIEKINARLEQTNLRRIGRGRVVSLEGDQQKTLDKIRDITRMTDNSVNDLIAAYREMAAQKMSETDKEGNFIGGDPSEYQYEIAMLETFGALNSKNPEDLMRVYRMVDGAAAFGRDQVKAFIEANRERYKQMRAEVVDIITGGKGLMSNQDAKRAKAKIHEGVIKKGNLMAKDFESMLQLISNNDKRLLKDTMLHSDFIVKVHKAFQNERAENRENEAEFLKTIDEFFGIKGDWQRQDFLVGINEQVEDTGIMRHQRPKKSEKIETKEELGKWLKFVEVSTEDGRILLRNYDETGKGLTDYQAESLRAQIAAKDQKFKDKLPVNKIGEEFVDSVLKVVEELEKTDKVAILTIHSPGPLVMEPMSKAEALHNWLMWRQPSLKYKMQFNGWTEESIRHIEEFLSPDAKFADSPWGKIADWMVERLKNDLPEINKVSSKLWLSQLPGEDFYFPGTFKINKNVSQGKADIADAYSGGASITPGALLARKFHLMEPKPENAFAIFARHRMDMAHFKHYAEVARDMAAVFGNGDVQEAIRQYHGEQPLIYLHAKIQDIVNGGDRHARHYAIVDAMQGVFAKTRIFYNTISMVKQAAGTLSYINKIPVGAYVRYQGHMLTNFSEFKDTAEMLMRQQYFINRFHGGMERDTSIMLMKSFLAAKDMSSRWEFLDKWGSLPTRAGDAFASIVGGYTVYKYHYDNLIKQGVPQARAHETAITEWELATERTQQTANPAGMNRMQLGGSFDRILTTFMGNPIILMNDFVNAAGNVIHGRGTAKERYALAAKTGFTAWVISGFVMNAISQAAKHGINLDEWEIKRMLAGSLFGPFASYSVPGMAIDAVGSWFLGVQNSKSTAIDDIGNIGRVLRKAPDIFTGDMDPEDIYKTIEKAFLALGMFGASELVPPLKPLTLLNTNTSAVMRELRRYWNLAFGEEKNSKGKNVKL